MNSYTLKNQWFGNIKGDVLSGIVVAMALIPEAIAFSLIAGVDPIIGLYASFCIEAHNVSSSRKLAYLYPYPWVSAIKLSLFSSIDVFIAISEGEISRSIIETSNFFIMCVVFIVGL